MNDSEPVDLILLQTFAEVARAGSITHAARTLGRSQPAISHRLRALERSLGVRLFEKVGRRLQLTEYGRRLEHECLDLMARSQHLRERVIGSTGDMMGRVSIGTLPTLASHLLVPALREFFDTFPQVSLHFGFDHVLQLCDRLRTGEFDVLVVIGEVLETEGLKLQPVGAASLVAVMSPAMAPRHRRSITPAQLRRQRYLSFGGGQDPTFHRIEAYAHEHELSDDCTPRVPHIETLRELAAAGAGYAIIPAYTTWRDQGLGRLVARQPVGLDDQIPVMVLGRRNQVMTPALEAVRRAFRDLEQHLKG